MFINRNDGPVNLGQFDVQHYFVIFMHNFFCSCARNGNIVALTEKHHGIGKKGQCEFYGFGGAIGFF